MAPEKEQKGSWNGWNVWALTWPRQHGAWSVLGAGFLLGMTGQRWETASVLLAAAVLWGFLARHTVAFLLHPSRSPSLRLRLLPWATIYTALALFFGTLLVLGFHRWLLLPLGGAALALSVLSVALERGRKDRTTLGEMVGMLGLSLVIPAAAYASSGLFSGQTMGLWALGALFFTGSVFHVRYLVRHRRESRQDWHTRLRTGGGSLAYHLAGLAIAWLLSYFRALPPLAPLALLPVTAKAFWTVGRRQAGRINIQRIGFIELAHTLAFVALTSLSFHLPQ
jgi:hypothetical protein